jgi:hypothetical protein
MAGKLLGRSTFEITRLHVPFPKLLKHAVFAQLSLTPISGWNACSFLQNKNTCPNQSFANLQFKSATKSLGYISV